MGAETIRTLIVDDEPLARELVARLLYSQPEFTVVGTCAGGEEAVRAIREIGPDLVFLDIEMPDLSGFQVLQRLAPEDIPYVVFVTAWDHYAPRAFDVHAFDYLLKPVERDRFVECLDRVKSALRREGLTELAERVLRFARGQVRPQESTDPSPRRISFQHRERLLSLPVEEIVWIEAADQYARLHTEKNDYLLSRSLSSLEEELPGRWFMRIHRSALVNLRFVREVRPAEFGAHWIILVGDRRLRLARSRRELLDRLVEAAST